MSMTLALDITFAVLLIVTIGYAIVLNRKLGSLQKHKDDLERLAMTFSQSTARADDSIQNLKRTTENLQNKIDKAQGLRDDLSFLVDRGSMTADRLEEGVRGARINQDEPASRPKKNLVDPIETVADAAHARRRDPTAGINIVGGHDANTEEDLAEQKSQAEKDLIAALRQVR